jgi:hypothetical protein
MVDRSGLMKRGERGGCMLELKLELRLECKEGEWDMSMCMSSMGMMTKTRVRMRETLVQERYMWQNKERN